MEKVVPEAEELPRAIVRRVVKDKLSHCSPDADMSVHKDALLAFSESARIFIHYLSATANDICRESKRQTINANDVLKALEDIEFPDFVMPLKASLDVQALEHEGKEFSPCIMRQNSGGEFGNSVAKLLDMDLSSMVWREMRRGTWGWNGLTQQVEVRYQELPSTFGHWGKCWASAGQFLYGYLSMENWDFEFLVNSLHFTPQSGEQLVGAGRLSHEGIFGASLDCSQ
ncbi:hypothetical protein FH972_010012 [Carpinus fangiana]|uniref:Transcription factor CBF/NF-Y/archaeal histone domain-containing protein n=1 Tax=Carpinus fangiana TaxID=176857 RepID=A0A660KNM5_9ROSI|nr:hypothetical protein FH972_010012 [Carpinus fangiana]